MFFLYFYKIFMAYVIRSGCPDLMLDMLPSTSGNRIYPESQNLNDPWSDCPSCQDIPKTKDAWNEFTLNQHFRSQG